MVVLVAVRRLRRLNTVDASVFVGHGSAGEQTLNLVIYFGVCNKLLRAGRPAPATAFKVIYLAGCALYHPVTHACRALPRSLQPFFSLGRRPSDHSSRSVLRRIGANSNHVYANGPAQPTLFFYATSGFLFALTLCTSSRVSTEMGDRSRVWVGEMSTCDGYSYR